MATFQAKGTGTTGASSYTLKLVVNETSYSAANNTSEVSWALYLISTTYNFSTWSFPITASVDGQVYSSSQNRSLNKNSQITIGSGTKTITHNSDGTKSISCSATCAATGASYLPGNINVSGTLTLTTIPRASSITATDANIESVTTININRASTGFSHTITYSFGGLTGNIATKNWSVTHYWTVPSSFYAKMPNSKTGTVTLTCITYSGDTEIGRKNTTFTITASESKCKPTISAALIDSNATTVSLTGDNTKLVRYKSTAKITPTATVKNSATVSSIKVNGTTVSGSYIEFQNVQSTSFTVTVTDSRGYSASTTLNPTIIPYIQLTSTAKFTRTTATGSEITLNYEGNYFNGNFSTNTANQLTISWKYKEKGASSWINGGTLTPTISNNKYSGQASLGSIYNYQKSYDFILYISDRLMSADYQDNVSRGVPYFDYGEDANGDNYFCVNGDFYIKDNNKVLWSGNESPNGKTYTLADNIYNYRFVIIQGQYGAKFIVPILKNDTYLNGGTNYVLGAGNAIVTVGITAAITDNGNKISVTYFRYMNHTSSSNHAAISDLNLLQIIGVK